MVLLLMYPSRDGEGNKNGLASQPGNARNSRSTATACGASGNVFPLHLHPLSRYAPQGFISFEICEFGPPCCSQFGRASKGKHHEPQGETRPLIAVIGPECFEKSWHLIERHRLVSARSAGRFERAPQIGRWIVFSSAACDGVSKNLTADLP